MHTHFVGFVMSLLNDLVFGCIKSRIRSAVNYLNFETSNDIEVFVYVYLCLENYRHRSGLLGSAYLGITAPPSENYATEVRVYASEVRVYASEI